MKKVLIPVYEYYPLNSGGTFRLGKFSKYLREFGFEPIVVAPNWTSSNSKYVDHSMIGIEHCRVERVNFEKASSLRKNLHTLLYKATLHPKYFHDCIGESIYLKCKQICEEEKIDIIFSSSLPQFTHWVATELNKQFNIPWVADFRDIVDQEKILEDNVFIRNMKRLRMSQKIALDIHFAKSAKYILTVSSGLKDKLTSRFKNPVDVIMNGFDPDDFNEYHKSIGKVINSKFTIIYPGSFFGNRNPKILLDGLEILVYKKPEIENDIQIVFYGRSSESIKQYIKDYRCNKLIVSGGLLTHQEAIKKMMSADLLYLISHPSKGIATGKIFEYLASKKLILSIPGDNDITDDIIKSTNAGIIASTAEDVADTLLKLYEEWKMNGQLKTSIDSKAIETYTRVKQSQELAEVLNLVLDHNRNN